MKIADLPFGNISMLEIKAARGFPEDFAAGVEVWLRPETSTATLPSLAPDALLILPGSRTIAWVQPANLQDGPAFRQLLTSPWPRLMVVAKRAGETSLILRVHEFTLLQPWAELAAIEIGFDEAMGNRVIALTGVANPPADAAAILLDSLSLPPVASGHPRRLFVTTAAAEPESTFFLHGAVLTAKIQWSDGAALSLVDVSGPSAPVGRLLVIELTNLSFIAGTAPVPSALVRNMLLRLVAGTEKYLQLWQQYNALDRERLDEEARDIGYLRYDSVERHGDDRLRYTLADVDTDSLSELREAASRGAVELEAGPVVPDHLAEDEARSLPPLSKGRRPARRATSRGRCGPDDIDPHDEWIDLRIDSKGSHQAPPPQGYLYLSQGGSRVALKRQTIAWEAIRAGRTPMPQLGLILENQPLMVQPIQPTNHITQAVRAQFRGGNPTPRQQEAIEIAVNTPDIALIQGPPGTGKTEVITAIIKRLEQLADPSKSVAGLFLVTSQQHVAVRNVVNKIQPFGLPAVKRGRGRDEIEGAQEAPEATRKWANEVINRIKTQAGNDTKPIAGLRKFERQLESYSRGHHWLDDTVAMLDEVARDAASLASARLVGEIRELAMRLRTEKREQSRGLSPVQDRAYRAAYALRYEPASFADDGHNVAARALDVIGAQGLLTEEDRKVLEWARKEDAAAAIDKELLAALGALRERLLRALRPEGRPLSVIAAPRADVMGKLTDLVADVRRRICATRSGLALVLDDYAVEIGQNFHRLEQTLLQYSAARAETCQASASTLYSALRRTEGPRGFETVIIDEAARANPLDLLIPMAQARRRIILVGDHNQLPHTLEPKLEGIVKDTFADEEQRALKMSLFERLFLDLQERQDNGEARRTVTLDTQYRMHQLLGEFVSEQFYNNELGSAPATAQYRHGLKSYRLGNGEDCVASWIDVPVIQRGDRSIGTEKRGKSRSRSREREADAIRYAVRDILKQQPDQKIGVISFYADQVALIRDKLRTIGGGLADIVRTNVHVGTVDAFQGEQFPIIFLSMTRSNVLEFDELAADTDPENAKLERENRARLRYGHLMLKNRMCVAFSRQQLLMVVVGDRRMLVYPERGAIAPLVAFDQLCRRSGLHFLWTGKELQPVVQRAEGGRP